MSLWQEYLRSAVLIGVAFYACRQSTGTLRLYLGFEWKGGLVLEGVRLLVFHGSYDSGSFFALFTVVRLLVLFCAFMYVREFTGYSSREGTAWFTGGLFGLGLAFLAYTGMSHPISHYGWLGIALGCAFTWLAVALGLSLSLGPHEKARNRNGIALCLLWLDLAVFQFGFSLHMPAEIWVKLNDFWPAISVLVAFAFIGRSGSRFEQKLAHG